ncbi:MAG: hypothetical protein KatS3mg121_0100 [Gammaproteobacteria bacterium]|nr:MAG: hypothetical protein KatS3mg121_0100 [Gammaproteobacteria bacterium]
MDRRSPAVPCPPAVLWFFGPPAAGKTTLARRVQRRLAAAGRSAVLLDGDRFRARCTPALGFARRDRAANLLRAARLVRRLAEAGHIVLAAFVTPYEAHRRRLAAAFADIGFLPVFCDCPPAVCEARDPKGLYRRARAGRIRFFTGVSAPFERPVSGVLALPTDRLDPERCADRVMARLEAAPVLRVG